MRFWATVRFSAQGGRTAVFLQHAADAHFRLRDIQATLGGVTACCDAARYVSLVKLAKKYRVHLRCEEKMGLFFQLRPLLRRKGLFLGMGVFVLLLALFAQNLIWKIEYIGFSAQQEVRAKTVLAQTCGIMAGSYATQALLLEGEEALLQQEGLFAWVSLNFVGGRLVVEAAPYKAVPDIAQGELRDITARVAGCVQSVNVQNGTALVKAGDEVEEGQVLISMVRLEHDQETLVYAPVAGQVRAVLADTQTIAVPLVQNVVCPTGNVETVRTLLFCGQRWRLPFAEGARMLSALGRFVLPQEGDALTQETTRQSTQEMERKTVFGDAQEFETAATKRTRYVQLTVFGLPLPLTIQEESAFEMQPQTVVYTEEEALQLARLQAQRALYEAFADAQELEVEETYTCEKDSLQYTVVYQIVADIGVQ